MPGPTMKVATIVGLKEYPAPPDFPADKMDKTAVCVWIKLLELRKNLAKGGRYHGLSHQPYKRKIDRTTDTETAATLALMLGQSLGRTRSYWDEQASLAVEEDT